MRTLVLVATILSLTLTTCVTAQDTTKPTTNTGPVEYAGKTLKQWVEEIDKRKNTDPGLRHRAIQAVMLFDPEQASKEASSVLIEAVSDPDTSIRVNAMIALAVVGVHTSQTKEALAALVGRLEDGQGIVRLHAAVVLGRMDTAARPALPALLNRLRDGASYEIRKQVVIAVARVGAAQDKTPLDIKAVQALLQMVTGGVGNPADRSAEVRLAAVTSLGEMGIPSTPADKIYLTNGLKGALKDPQPIIQVWAHVSLMKIDGVSEEQISGLLKLLRGTDQLVRVEAIRALGAVGPKAIPSSKATIFEILDDKDLGLVANAAWAVGEWGTSCEEALPKLQKLCDSKDVDERIKPIIREAMRKVKGEKPKN